MVGYATKCERLCTCGLRQQRLRPVSNTRGDNSRMQVYPDVADRDSGY